jgi:dTDP-4-dehydrorhamnose reductase
LKTNIIFYLSVKEKRPFGNCKNRLMKLVITGSNGLLGQKIVNQCISRGIDFMATSKGANRNNNCPDNRYQSLDICDRNAVFECLNSIMPTHVIHTAAMTNVDQCELNPTDCNEINVIATHNLWSVSTDLGIHFQLLSTDFVFDGIKGNYSENDVPNPLSIYAQSKVDAENILLKSSSTNWSIVRTIIVYGQGDNLSRNNIICWAKESLSKGQVMKIIDDQFRAPTWADDLAWACIRICERDKKGIYHISGPETMSVFEIVERVAKYYELETHLIERTDSSTLSQPAKRPPRTGFNLSKAKQELDYNPKTLEETLALLV